MYKVKEVFHTLQGEGINTGRAAVFLRFAGCNLWSGLEQDRDKGPSCSRWCDTDFVGGEVVRSPADLADKLSEVGPVGLVVVTGGEPMLQLDLPLARILHGRGWEVAVETNGTVEITPSLFAMLSVTVSPKPNTRLRQRQGKELKLVWPQEGTAPELYDDLDFDHRFLQPLDDDRLTENTAACVEYVKAHPRWRLSVQTHKYIGVR